MALIVVGALSTTGESSAHFGTKFTNFFRTLFYKGKPGATAETHYTKDVDNGKVTESYSAEKVGPDGITTVSVTTSPESELANDMQKKTITLWAKIKAFFTRSTKAA
jgi:hypothetical protein